LWWSKSAPLPVPLVTRGSPTDAAPGALGKPGTTVLYGGQAVDYGVASGLRITAGLMLQRDLGLSLEGSWFMLERQSQNFAATSNANGQPLLAQPIVDAATGAPAAEPVSVPNPFGVGGGISVSNTTRLEGWDVNLGLAAWSTETSRLTLLAGFRSLNLLESLTVDTDFRDISGIPGGAGLFFLGKLNTNAGLFTTEDRFRVSNNFYGGQLGARFFQKFDRFDLILEAKVALGSTNEVVTINGFSTLAAPGQPPLTAPGGVLALPSNIGRHSRSQFTVVPEGTVTVGMQVTSWLRAFVGYDFLYWSEVARPGDQVDLTVNRAAVPTSGQFGLGTGPARPAFNFQGTDYWAQGLTFGLQFRY
jgi:hypothetical protein